MDSIMSFKDWKDTIPINSDIRQEVLDSIGASQEDINKMQHEGYNNYLSSLIEITEDNIKKLEFFTTTKELDLDDGSQIAADTDFIIEGYEDGKYGVHFSVDERNQYNNEYGDNYSFTIDEIKSFARPADEVINEFINNGPMTFEEWRNTLPINSDISNEVLEAIGASLEEINDIQQKEYNVYYNNYLQENPIEIKEDNVKIKIYASESNLIRPGEIYSLDEANAIFDKAAEVVRDLKKNSLEDLGEDLGKYLEQDFMPEYNKIIATIELSDGGSRGFRYDAGDPDFKNLTSYLKDTFKDTFSDIKEISKSLENVVQVGDIVLDKDNNYNFVNDIKNEKYELFPVAVNANNNISSITDLEINDNSKVIKAGSFKTLNKSDIRFKAGHVEKSELNSVVKKIDFFKRKDLVHDSSNTQKVSLENTIESSLEL